MKTGPKPRLLRDRFEEKYIPEPNSGCWLWTAATLASGYGIISITRSRFELAHRVSYKLYKGEIPNELEIDHLCKVRCCVNPDHLEAVTYIENLFRARKKQCMHGHLLSGDNLRLWTSPTTGYEQRICITCHRAASAAGNERRKMR